MVIPQPGPFAGYVPGVTQENLHGEPFVVGDRVSVSGGYDEFPHSLKAVQAIRAPLST
jgi:hypothetical protein